MKFLEKVRAASAALGLMAAAAGCTTSVKMDKTYWINPANKGIKVGIVRENHAMGEFYVDDSGRPVRPSGAIVLAASADFNKFLNGVTPPDALIEAHFAESLTKMGYKPKVISGRLDRGPLDSFKKPEGAEGVHSDKDLSKLAAQEGVDHLVILTVTTFGTMRDYGAFIAFGAPKPFMFVRGEFVRLKDHKVLWRETVGRMAEVEGEWDQKPDYPNVIKALEVAAKKVGDDLAESFFEK